MSIRRFFLSLAAVSAATCRIRKKWTGFVGSWLALRSRTRRSSHFCRNLSKLGSCSATSVVDDGGCPFSTPASSGATTSLALQIWLTWSEANWMWDVQAAYPIFEGGARAEDEKLNVSEVARLEKEIIDARQVIECRVRSSVRAIEGSFPSIGYLNAAAESARRNFEIVQDRYTEGLVNVTDLLEAQNDRFTTERTARGAQYAFLLDLVALQRAIGWFEDMKTKEERDQLLEQARAYIDKPSPPPAEGEGAGVLDLVAPSRLASTRARAGTQDVVSGRKP